MVTIQLTEGIEVQIAMTANEQKMIERFAPCMDDYFIMD